MSSRRAGQFNKRLVLQKRIPSTDAEGATSDNWVTVGKLWASVQSTAGNELLEGAQPEARITHQVTTDYRSELAPPLGHQARLLLGARILDITTAMDPDESLIQMDLLCVERQR
jgi:SPP1 family predicted phage head-tail adaptor